MDTLTNGQLEIAVKRHGAELCSIICAGRQYLWNGDPQYWKRHSPVLFPIVGSLWEGECRIDGRTYRMGQHGFARDMDFEQIGQTSDSLLYALESSEETLERFPYPFRLEIGYRISGKEIEVSWTVVNTGAEEMPFQIGAHPAFLYPQFDPDCPNRGSFDLHASGDSLEYILIGEKGCAATSRRYPCGSHIDLSPSTFDADALIFDRGQIDKVTLNSPDGTPYLSLMFDAPLVGLWSPVGKNAPFVCIEPWYGRCDRMNFTGSFRERDEIQLLAPSASFHASYHIRIEG